MQHDRDAFRRSLGDRLSAKRPRKAICTSMSAGLVRNSASGLLDTSKASKRRGLLSGRALLEFEVAEAKTCVRNDGYNDEAGPA